MTTRELIEQTNRLLLRPRATDGAGIAEIGGGVTSTVSRERAGEPAPSAAEGATELLTRELAQLRQALGRYSEGIQTAVLTSNTGGGEVSQTVKNVLDQAGTGWGGLGAGLMGSPVVGVLSHLFGGKKQPPAIPLEPVALPRRIDAAVGITQGGVAGEVSYGTDQVPRVSRPTQAVTIQVQAMDSRSFLDHSDEIARAVQHAMLNAHSINDVLGDL